MLHSRQPLYSSDENEAIGLAGSYDHPLEAYQIKHTAYNSLGFGPVIHISRNKMEMFFFKYVPDPVVHYLDEEQKIVGIYRTYCLNQDKFVKDSLDRVVFINSEKQMVGMDGISIYHDY